MANFTKEESYQAVHIMVCTASFHGNHFLYSVAVLNILLSITATLENILIFVALRMESSLRPPSKLLFRCLTASDLLVGVFLQPLFAVQIISTANRRLHLCCTVSNINEITGTTLIGVSLFTLTSISIDRLLAMLLGLRYRKTVTLRRTRGIVICCWVLFTFTSLLRRFWKHVATISKVMSVIIYSMLGVSALSYMAIYLILRRHQTKMKYCVHQGRLTTGARIPLNIARYKKTVSTALWVQLTLVACYLPYGVVSAVAHPYTPSINRPLILSITLVLLNSSLNPILYCWKIRGVRKAVKNAIKQMHCFVDKEQQKH